MYTRCESCDRTLVMPFDDLVKTKNWRKETVCPFCDNSLYLDIEEHYIIREFERLQLSKVIAAKI